METQMYYGCVKCQKEHYENDNGGIYHAHILHQSKHGLKTATAEETDLHYGHDCSWCEKFFPESKTHYYDETGSYYCDECFKKLTR